MYSACWWVKSQFLAQKQSVEDNRQFLKLQTYSLKVKCSAVIM